MSVQRVSEDIDYELIPSSEVENEQAWDVRVLRGSFVETVIRFGNIAFNENNGCLNFNFMVVSTPDSTVNEDREDLQQFAGDVLESILENAIANDSLVSKDRNED